jgi:hypothetical protein
LGRAFGAALLLPQALSIETSAIPRITPIAEPPNFLAIVPPPRSRHNAARSNVF